MAVHRLLVHKIAFRSRNVRSKWKLKQRMKRNASRIDSGNAGGCGHDHFLKRILTKIFQKRRLARSRFSGEENIQVRFRNETVRQIKRLGVFNLKHQELMRK